MIRDVNGLARRLETGMAGVMAGGERTTFALLVALLGRGHVLIEGVPGTGKTLAVRAFAMLLGLEYKRVQFTPDLMPADVIGTMIFNPQSLQFTMRRGPVFANVLLADEINRTPPKTQSALLEAMEEGRVTIDGEPVLLPRPFIVCATQNPIEYEGTYPLPEAQLDRFMVKIEAHYPQQDEELALLERGVAGFDARDLEAAGLYPVTDAGEVIAAQEAVRRVRATPAVQRYVYDVVAATRAHPQLTLGASPRAALALIVAAQAAALIDGRDFVTPDDVKDAAPIVLPHRLIVAPHAEIEGVRAQDAIAGVLAEIPVPRESS